jgi:hypothetical protein
MEINADEREGVMPSKPADRLDGTDFNFTINTSVLFDRVLSQPTSTRTRLGVVSLGSRDQSRWLSQEALRGFSFVRAVPLKLIFLASSCLLVLLNTGNVEWLRRRIVLQEEETRS